MANKPHFTTEQARQIGEALQIDWGRFDVEQFRMGLDVELEHGLRDPETKAHTALLLREMTGQMFSMSRPGDWVNWWKQTHPDWKEEKDEK